ncbi:Exocyst complex component EXO70A1 like [Actinidia chinensis var. chinensis]|uniref:Exocyst subunit Exo70 family protein n=1 Tax=Actinidia chinensis var. chinensis TaxID=1590841 RepID=A0A2R6PV49_ACTCC|nr:Exocyst complex component EXO70A1 like [Actinidia chinensis var. chinensis]
MAELGSIENLVAVRRLLKSSLQKSREIASEIDKTGSRFEEMNRRLPSLKAAIKTIGQKCSLLAIRGHIDHTVGPATSVLKVFEVVHGIEGLLLSDPSSDLFGYLSLVKQLEGALRFLTDNCGLVIRWLEDVVQFLEDNTIDDDWYLLTVRKSLMILGELQAIENRSSLTGGSLFGALEKLETEFRHLLMENSFPMDFSLTSGGNEASLSAQPMPVAVIQKLQAILERVKANNRIEKCITIYVEVRSSNAKATMQALDLNYLDISISEFESVQSIEDYIYQWGNHLEFAVKHLFELEYRLSNDVFQKDGSEVLTSCFADIAIQSGIQGFIKFANTITKGKKDAIKLLKLLDIFTSLNKLRLDFNRLFGGKACVEIQTQMRDLIKKVVDGACGIFWELSVQVDLQRQCTPPSDGSVSRLVSFVTDYCNQLLEDDYRLILIHVLEIHQVWNDEKFEESLLSDEVFKIMSAIEQNLETWAKRYENTALSYLFMMNNHWYLFKYLQGTNLGNLMGDSWLKCHEQRTEYYAAVFLRESWGKLPALLSEEGLILFSGGTAITRDLVKKRLKAFSEVFDDIYKKQSNWVVSDKSLRLRTCQLVVQIIVPVYRRFMQSYTPLVKQGTSPNKYVKYSADNLENIISSLFQQKLGQYGSTKYTQLIGEIKNVVTSHLSSTPAAA